MIKTNPTVYIVSASFNQRTQVKKLLSDISDQSYPHIRVFFVDDGSHDKTSDYIKKNFPKVNLLSGNGNLWWTGALRWGVDSALEYTKKEDFILTINSDCSFEPNYVQCLVNESLKHRRSIVGSLILDNSHSGRIVDAGVRINWSRGNFISTDKFPGTVDTVSTRGTLYPLEVFETIGNFDEKHFPHYISDYEFGCRAVKAGFRIQICEDAKIYNDINQTGIGDILPKEYSLKYSFQLLFSRKSRRNIFDHFWFITFCCPLKWKLHNYLLLILKSIYIVCKSIYFFSLE